MPRWTASPCLALAAWVLVASAARAQQPVAGLEADGPSQDRLAPRTITFRVPHAGAEAGSRGPSLSSALEPGARHGGLDLGALDGALPVSEHAGAAPLMFRTSETFGRGPLRLELGMARLDPAGEGPMGQTRLGIGGLGGVAVAEGELGIYDLSLRWRALRAGPVSLSLIGGVRAMHVDVLPDLADDPYSRMTSFTPIPVAGGGLRWDVGRGVFVRGQGVGHAGEDEGSFYDLTLETGLGVSSRAEVSLGFQHLRAVVGEGSGSAGLNRDAVLLQFRVRY